MIPQELKDRRQWVTWRYENGTKVPYAAKTGERASSTNPDTWTTYQSAIAAADTRKHDGVGYVFSPDDPYVGIDLDDCIDANEHLAPWAQEIVSILNSYSEVSPSGKGVKIWVKGEIPRSVKTANVEMYSERRYFTVTGRHIPDTPDTIRSVNGTLTKLYETYNTREARTPNLPAPIADIQNFDYRKWALGALEGERTKMQSVGEGTRHEQRYRSAFALGGLVPHITPHEIMDALSVNFGQNKSNAMQTIADGIRDGMQFPRNIAAETQMNARPVLPTRTADSSANSVPMADVAQPTKPRFTILRGDELDKIPPVEWLIENEIPLACLTVLYGESGAGKSFVALDYALRIAQEHNVVYVAPEGASGYKARKASWQQYNKLGDGGFYLCPDTVNVLDHRSVYDFIESVKEIAPKAVIVDTMARSMLGGDENSAKDVGLFVEGCAILQRTLGAAVLVVHHTGKAGDYRGSSALRGAADMMIELQNDDGLITMICKKTKDTAPFPSRYMRLMVYGDSCVVLPASKVDTRRSETLTTRQVQVLDVLGMSIFEATGASGKHIIDMTGIPYRSAYRILDELRDRPIPLVAQAAKGDPFYISEDGKLALQKAKQLGDVPHEKAAPQAVVPVVPTLCQTENGTGAKVVPVVPHPFKGVAHGTAHDTDTVAQQTQPNKEQIKFLKEQLPKRGAAWANQYMQKTGGITNWPLPARQMVKNAEKYEAQHKAGEPQSPEGY